MNNGEDQIDICPNYGIHKYFPSAKTYTDFEPLKLEGALLAYALTDTVYIRHEYILMSCNCGEAWRKEVVTRQ